jgi:hypothetical protein
MLAKQAPAGRPETKVESARRNVWFFVCVPDPAAKGAFMQILVSRACGIDVHKDMLAVCVLVYRDGKEPEARYKEFASHQKALTALGNWLSWVLGSNRAENRCKSIDDAPGPGKRDQKLVPPANPT